LHTGLVQGMKGRRGGTHHDCAVLEWNLIWKQKDISTGNFDEFAVAAVAMLPDHLHLDTELFVTAEAEITATATDQVMHIDAVVRRDVGDFFADRFHMSRDFVPER
jgi:hypothetical protein